METGILKEAVPTPREAVKAMPKDLLDAERGDKIASPASQLGALYLRKGTIADLEEAINVAQGHITVTPNGKPTLIGKYTALSGLPGHRYARIGSTKDLEEAIDVTCQTSAVRTLLSFMDVSREERP